MKQKILVITIVLLASLAGFTQDIKFTYDDAGNRTSRHVIPPGSTVKTTEEPATETSFLTNDESSGTKSEVKPEVYEDNLSEMQIKIYPNPTRGRLRIEMENYNWDVRGNIKVFDMGGRLVQNITNLNQSMEIDITNKPPGTYIIVIVIGNEKSEWEIIKQ